MRHLAKLLFIALVVPLVGCESPDAASTLVLTGSSTVAPLAAELGRAFEASHPGVRVDVQTGGSSRGIQDAKRGLADIGMASRALRDDERALTAHTIAFDGITLIVNAGNPITKLGHEQVRALFTGQVTSWAALGGPDERPVIVNKAEGRSTLELFLEHFDLAPEAIAADVVIGDNQQGLKTVAANRWAIGYVSIGAAAYESAHGAPIRLLKLDGVEPTLANVAAGRFPLSRPLNLLTLGPVEGLAAAFLAFATSEDAEPFIEAQFFVAPGAR